MEPLLGGISQLSRRYPKAVLMGLALITLFLGAQLPRLEVAYDPSSFVPEHPRVEASRQIEKEFGVGSFSHLIAVRFAPLPGYRVDSPQSVIEMEEVLQALRTVPGVISAEGIPDFIKFVRSQLHGGDPRFYILPLAGDELGYSFEEIIRMAFQRMALLKKFTSQEGTAVALATIAKDADIVKVARAAEQKLAPLTQRAVALEIGLASYGETLGVFQQTTQRDIRRLTPIVLVLVALTLAWVFRLTRPGDLALVLIVLIGVAAVAFSPELFPTVTLPISILLSVLLIGLIVGSYRRLASLYLTLAVVSISGVWAFGLLGLTGVPLNFLMAAVVPLLLGIGDDYSIHLLHRYEEERCKRHEGPEAMDIALARTGRALLLTTLTTVVGFASLLFAPSPPVRWFGLLAALSMMSALIVTVTLIPAAKQLFKEGPRVEPWPNARLFFGHPKESIISRWLACYTGLFRWRTAAIVALIFSLALGAFGYWEGRSLQTYTVDYRRIMPSDYPVVKVYTQINQEFRTYDEVQIYLRGDVARLEVMRLLLKEVPEALAASPYAHRITSIAHYIDDVRAANSQLAQGFMERFLQSPDAAYHWILDEIFARDSLRQRAEAYIKKADGDQLTADSSGYEASVVRVNTMRFSDQTGIRRVAEDLEKRLEPVMTKLERLGLSVQLTGAPFLEQRELESLHRSLTLSVFIAFALCLGVIVLLLRSAVWGAMALFPMVLVTGFLLGTVNLLGIELNASTAIVAAISIGLGVGYAIHLLQRFMEEKDLVKATARTGEALFAAFFTTASAFFVLMLSTITWTRDFGLLVGLAVFYAFLATALFFPALLALTGRADTPARTASQKAELLVRAAPSPNPKEES